jgi:hypothetical protein
MILSSANYILIVYGEKILGFLLFHYIVTFVIEYKNNNIYFYMQKL